MLRSEKSTLQDTSDDNEMKGYDMSISSAFGGTRVAEQPEHHHIPRSHVQLWHFVEHPIGFQDLTKPETETLGQMRPSLEFPAVISESVVIIRL